jgi:hypothetical protein
VDSYWYNIRGKRIILLYGFFGLARKRKEKGRTEEEQRRRKVRRRNDSAVVTLSFRIDLIDESIICVPTSQKL